MSTLNETTPETDEVEIFPGQAGRPGQVSRPVMQLMRQAIRSFGLIEPKDRIAVGLSGGKDSFLLAHALTELSRSDEYDFELVGVHLDQHQPGFDRERFDRALALLDIPCEIVSEDTYSVVQERLKPGQIPCSVCGRLRRGILNTFCQERGFNKLALGHHLDDAVETFLLNLFYGRRLDPLKPATPSHQQITTIRPLILVEERKIAAWVDANAIPIVACPVCDTVPESRRRDLKQVMSQFEALHVDVRASVRTALYEQHAGLALIKQSEDDHSSL